MHSFTRAVPIELTSEVVTLLVQNWNVQLPITTMYHLSTMYCIDVVRDNTCPLMKLKMNVMRGCKSRCSQGEVLATNQSPSAMPNSKNKLTKHTKTQSTLRQ